MARRCGARVARRRRGVSRDRRRRTGGRADSPPRRDSRRHGRAHVSFLAPLWFAVAAAAVAGVIALHLITTQRPPPAPLPTARFVPQGDARASSRAARPTDLLLLLLRCVALLLLGTAFAGPVTRSRGASLARVIVVDRSRGSLRDVRDSAVAIARSGGAIVLFDSSATIVTRNTHDSLAAFTTTPARGSLSAALVGARRAARDLAA